MQLGIAMQNYESAHEILPAGVINPTGPIQSTARGYHAGWMLQLLPFLEQRNIARRWNDTMGVYSAENVTARSAVVNIFLCPSDSGPMRHNGDNAALGSYAACHHDVEAPIDADNTGAFFLNSRLRSEDITDGTSCTIFMGEKLRDATELGWASGTRATLRNTGTKLNATRVLALSALTGEDDLPETETAAAANNPATSLVGGFSSPHAGGANFGFGDGSVRFLKNTINMQVYQYLGNRADGEVISGDQF
jgi:prepilin-type processing-associated H-X9-DG protein